MMLLNPYRFAAGGGPAAPTFAIGAGVTYALGNTSAASSGGWATVPLLNAIPSSGLWYVEFDTTGLANHEMFGVLAGGSVESGKFLGQSGSVADGVSLGDNSRLAGATFSWVDSTDFSTSDSSSVGLRVNQTTGRLRWYRDGVLQTGEASFTPGTAGLHFAIGVFVGRGAVVIKPEALASVPSGYSYVT